jgi:hypothetical protein
MDVASGLYAAQRSPIQERRVEQLHSGMAGPSPHVALPSITFPLCSILPWFGLELLDTARDLAEFDLPMRVMRLVWGEP